MSREIKEGVRRGSAREFSGAWTGKGEGAAHLPVVPVEPWMGSRRHPRRGFWCHGMA